MSDVWERRLRRAEELERLWPHSAEILRFFRDVTTAQRSLHEVMVEEGWDKIYIPMLRRRIPEFLARLRGSAPEKFREVVEGWEELDQDKFLEVLTVDWDLGMKGPRRPELLGHEPMLAIMKMIVEPFARVRHATKQPCSRADHDPGLCVFCERSPRASVLREDRSAETIRRTLVCSLCPGEWDFARVLCPSCKEERPEKLPRFTAQEIPWIRIEACDSCGKYLKAVDLSKEPGAEPVVDELASTPLDLLARERGYEKIAPNLAGL